ncbi:hypothetical protein JOB18_036270 [Solea senegalensis]|uniref:Myosin light chain kinase, smooth muscle isoform X2 n=1 Tax=Solea senegalensis TaxID=28829 RepID=A0AAV6RH44_SOLSE|nr:myosin light chain kinase, smooth muscle isoform X2 [Solea senegalensis]KAG7503327.1 hypothetical protein JOB18_036270 [Solea senegalensis]KAG7503328.1 hypothetical protein JOB18_036270 [Solea senegalensis]
MDFKSNLKGVKPKMQEERKVNSSQQVDFRSVLGKKSATNSNGSKLSDMPEKRSVHANKRTTGDEDKVNNCVDGRIHGKSNGGAAAAAGGGGGAAAASAAGGGAVRVLEFVEELSDVTVVDGQRLLLQCLLSTEPCDLAVTWTLDGKTIKASKFIILSNKDKALPEDEGQYRCLAESASGRAESCCTVLVDDPAENSPSVKKSTATLESEARIKKPTTKTPPKQALPPQILQFPEDMKILAGEKVEIICRFTGAPPINCTWLKFRKPIQEGVADMSIISDDITSRLTISSGQQEHCGCYTIELRNSYGVRQAALNLTIVDKPDPPAKVPAASDVRGCGLTLSWYGPTYDGGSAVQSYLLEAWDSVEQQWRHLVSCNSTSYNVQNLLPERQYKFRVRAQNVYGVGEPSAESEPVTVGLVDDDENHEEEVEDEDEDKEPEYRDVTIRTEVKVKELYDVEERLGTCRLSCAQCLEHPWLKQDTNTMKTKKLSKERMKKYILRRKWQKTGHAVLAIGRLSSMAMMAGVSAKKGSPTEEDNQFLECLEYEQKAESKPTFTTVIKDVEVVEGSAARFDCKIEGFPDPEVVWYKDEQPIKETRHFQIDYDEEGNCSLIISEVSGDDDAKYTVKAEEEE